MSVTVFCPYRAVDHIAVDLILAAERLDEVRAETDGVVAAMEARWAANRAKRACRAPTDRHKSFR